MEYTYIYMYIYCLYGAYGGHLFPTLVVSTFCGVGFRVWGLGFRAGGVGSGVGDWGRAWGLGI